MKSLLGNIELLHSYSQRFGIRAYLRLVNRWARNGGFLKTSDIKSVSTELGITERRMGKLLNYAKEAGLATQQKYGRWSVNTEELQYFVQTLATAISKADDEVLDNGNKKEPQGVNHPNTGEIIHCWLNTFDEHGQPKSAVVKYSVKAVNELLTIEKYPPEKIMQVIQWARNDSFWRTNFFSLAKLRRKNKDGVAYFEVFETQMKRNSPNGNYLSKPKTLTNSSMEGAFNELFGE